MRITGRRAAPPVSRMAAALGAVALLLVAGADASRAATQADDVDRGRPVALVLVRDLTWSSAPSSIDGFAKANLSMRTAEAASEAPDVYLSLGKGGRSAALGEGADAGVGRVGPGPGGGLRLLDWAALQDRDRRLRYGGTLGSVGQALLDGNRRWALASDDKDAAAVAATADGTVPTSYPGTPAGVEQAVEAGMDALFVAVPLTELAPVLEVLDARCTLVASASTPAHNRHLGVLATSPRCGLGTGGLASSSTHHAHLATLSDVSRTFLALVASPPGALVTDGSVTPAAAIERDTLVERDRRTSTADRSRTAFVWLFVALHAIGAVIAVRWRRSRTVVGCALMAVPAASLLMMLVPWWRAGAWVGLVVGGIVAALIAFGGALAARRDLALGVGGLAAVTAAVVAVDALFASPLQIDGPFGNSPVVAGRFFGMGNVGSGFLVAGLLVAGGLAIDRWGRRAVPWVAAALVGGTVAGGAPQFGADIGGVLFAVPAYGLLLLGSVRGRLSARHVLLLAGAAVVAVAIFAAVDLARDAGSQTHLARSVGDEGLVDEVLRKATRAVQTVKAPMAIVVVIAAAALFLTGFSPGSRRAVRHTAYAVLVAAVLGSLLNDSGLYVAAAVLAVAWPAGVMVASRSVEPRPSRTSVRT